MICDFLEDFATGKHPEATDRNPPNTAADKKRAEENYGSGYKEGWADAIEDHEIRQSAALENLAQAMQEASFTYFEARNHILNSMRPLIEELASKVMPDLAVSGLAPIIAERLSQLSREIETPITVCCAPESLKLLKSACENQIAPPVSFKSEPTLNEMQVLFRYADGSAEVDVREPARRPSRPPQVTVSDRAAL